MPNPKDTLSNESVNPKPKAPFGTQTVSKVLGKMADKVANSSIFGDMKSRTVAQADVPQLFNNQMPGQPAGTLNTSQMQVVHMGYVSPESGNTHQIEGYHLPAQPGKPTVVFFGGTDMDREADHYQKVIGSMALDAKRQGVGFLVMDYPPNANENKIHSYVDQMQDYLANDLGVPKNAQAYAGYSLGGNPALYAARTNPDAAGLHLTSTVSSIRQQSKNEMKAMFPTMSRAADKGQLTALMDNIQETRGLIQAQQNRPGGPMPVSIAYSDQERFGAPGNNHMAPLMNEFNNYPDFNNKVTVAVNTIPVAANLDAHTEILGSLEHLDGIKNLARSATQHLQAQAIAVPPVAVPPVAVPPVAVPPVAVPPVAVPPVAVPPVAGPVVQPNPVLMANAPNYPAPSPPGQFSHPPPNYPAPSPPAQNNLAMGADHSKKPKANIPAKGKDDDLSVKAAEVDLDNDVSAKVEAKNDAPQKKPSVAEMLNRSQSSPALGGLQQGVGADGNKPAANSLRASGSWQPAKPSGPKPGGGSLSASNH